MNISDAKTLGDLHLENLGLAANGWTIVVDKAKRRAGQCRYGKKEIGVSEVFIENSEEKIVEDTILHECAHALVGMGMGHGVIWRLKARAIGCTGNRLVDANFSTNGKYKGVCEKCGETFDMHRKPKKPDAKRIHIGCGGKVNFNFGE